MRYFFPVGKFDYVTGKKPDGCVLCLLHQGREDIPDLTFLKTNAFHASLNLYPYNPAHLMVFPIRHISDIRQFSAEETSELDRLTRYLLDMLDREYGPAGYNIGYNMGLEAGASIEHIHLHIIPRYPNEVGLADLVGGARVIVEEPMVTLGKLKGAVEERPFL